jgi:hypothetical protein
MKSVWDAEAARELRERVGRLSAERRAAWGRMSAAQVVCHLADSLKMALGELQVAPKNLPIRYPPLKQVIIYLAPFPKNAPTAPDLVARPPRAWDEDVRDLRSLLDRVSARGTDAQATWPAHPAFGRLSRRAWGVLIYRHVDHHLRQFGV